MIELFTAILKATAPPEAVQSLAETLRQQQAEFHQRKFYYAFSGATRHFGKTPVSLSAGQFAQIEAAIPGFTVAHWTEDQLARCLLLLSLARQPAERYRETLAALLGHADLREAAAIYAAFPLLPEPGFLVPFAREALRSNIVSVFDAIALRNPFPAAQFDEEGWNQMILKCFFQQRPTHLVLGLDRRANARLAEALSNYAHERWAASRPLSPDLWRSCAGFITEGLASDLARAAHTPAPGNREAVALVAAASTSPLLDPLRAQLAAELAEVRQGRLTWESLGKRLYPGS